MAISDDEALCAMALAGRVGAVLRVAEPLEAGCRAEEAPGQASGDAGAREAGVPNTTSTHPLDRRNKQTGPSRTSTNKWRNRGNRAAPPFLPSHVIRVGVLHGYLLAPTVSRANTLAVGARAGHEAADDCGGRTSAGFSALRPRSPTPPSLNRREIDLAGEVRTMGGRRRQIPDGRRLGRRLRSSKKSADANEQVPQTAMACVVLAMVLAASALQRRHPLAWNADFGRALTKLPDWARRPARTQMGADHLSGFFHEFRKSPTTSNSVFRR